MIYGLETSYMNIYNYSYINIFIINILIIDNKMLY